MENENPNTKALVSEEEKLYIIEKILKKRRNRSGRVSLRKYFIWISLTFVYI